MGDNTPKRLCIAAIDFLNPAPLMWDFEHGPRNTELEQRYAIHYTQPSQCAAELHAGRAGLGLIPIAALTPELAIVPGCTIASLDCVRSIQLIVKHTSHGKRPAATGSGCEPGLDPAELDDVLRQVRTVAADTASRSSVAYAEVLFRRFLRVEPSFVPTAADPVTMLRTADAALLIGDPALLALERRATIEAQPGVGPCLWIDVAHQWRRRTGLPWVAAVWAARPSSLAGTKVTASRLVSDLQQSRDAGLAHVDDLVAEWTPRIGLAPSTIRHYLTQNIHYTLNEECAATIELFRRYAAEAGVLPALPGLRFL
ncbi:MAG: menaquinone biosynthesis protein [Acidobacteriaceae bacterium]